MSKKFQVYAGVRSTRQVAGDIKEAIGKKANWNLWDDIIVEGEVLPRRRRNEAGELYDKWEDIERELNRLECKLERMDLEADA